MLRLIHLIFSENIQQFLKIEIYEQLHNIFK